MRLLDPSRNELQSLIGGSCLIASDRNRRALFVSDFPSRVSAAERAHIKTRLDGNGLICHVQDSLALIDWNHARYIAYFSGLKGAPLPRIHRCNAALWGLCRMLRQHDTPVEQQPIGRLRDALLMLDEGCPGRLCAMAFESLAEDLRLGNGVACGIADLLIQTGCLAS